MAIENVTMGEDVKIFHPDLVNLYGCTIGDYSTVGPFVEIQAGVIIGQKCKITSHSFICTGATIEDEVFIGHGVMFTNDLYPRATTAEGYLTRVGDFILVETLVKKGASIGSNATIIAGITIGEGALVGAGSVVTKDVPAHLIVAGNPAKIIRSLK